MPRAARLSLLATLLFAIPVRADDLQDGRAALRSGDHAKAFQLLLPLAQKGDPGAQVIVGMLQWRGLGTAKNPREAMQWLSRASEAGDAKAQDLLATAYHLGDGMQRNDAEALHWYMRAAKQGSAAAQLNLARLFYNGDGAVPLDKVEAYKWGGLAGAYGDSDAARWVALIEPTLDAAQIAEARRRIAAFKAVPESPAGSSPSGDKPAGGAQAVTGGTAPPRWPAAATGVLALLGAGLAVGYRRRRRLAVAAATKAFTVLNPTAGELELQAVSSMTNLRVSPTAARLAPACSQTFVVAWDGPRGGGGPNPTIRILSGTQVLAEIQVEG